MSDNTKIEWAVHPATGRGASWNPIRARNKVTGKIGWHCTHASEGCRHCYSESFNRRLGTGLPYKPGHEADIEIFLDEEMLTQPLRWKAPRGIFVCSMTDLFGDFVTDEMLDRIFAVMVLAPQHVFMVLTKRSARMRAYFEARRDGDPWAEAADEIADFLGMEDGLPVVLEPRDIPLSNIWLGVSAEDQQRADERVPDLLATPAAVRFVSAEPLLAPADFRRWLLLGVCNKCGYAGPFGKRGEHQNCNYAAARLPGIDWVVIGGESGANARSSWVPNIRSIVKQCQRVGTAVFVKQLGANVQDRNDAGFEGCEPHEWPNIDPADVEHDLDGTLDGYQGAPVRIHLRSRKGSDPAEWPEDLRVQEMPGVRP